MTDMSPENGKRIAMDAYAKNLPVIVFSNEGSLLHGKEELQAINRSGAELNCTILRRVCSLPEWEASEWPEIFEAARGVWLKGEIPE